VTSDTRAGAGVAAGDPLAVRVLWLLDMEPVWQGTASKLLNALAVEDKSPEFRKGFKTAKELSASLQALAPAVRTLGVEVTRGNFDGTMVDPLGSRDT